MSLFVLLLFPFLVGCNSNNVSEQEAKDIMMKHRPGYAETVGKQGKGDATGKPQRP
jgi:hypothetical protein